MEIVKNKKGIYNILNDGKLFGQISNGKQFNLYSTDGRDWKVSCIDTNHRLHGQRFRTLREGKKEIKSLAQS